MIMIAIYAEFLSFLAAKNYRSTNFSNEPAAGDLRLRLQTFDCQHLASYDFHT